MENIHSTLHVGSFAKMIIEISITCIAIFSKYLWENFVINILTMRKYKDA